MGCCAVQKQYSKGAYYRKRQRTRAAHTVTFLDTQIQKSGANGNNQGIGNVQTSEDILETISHGGHRSHKNLIRSKHGCSCQHLPGLSFFFYLLKGKEATRFVLMRFPNRLIIFTIMNNHQIASSQRSKNKNRTTKESLILTTLLSRL